MICEKRVVLRDRDIVGHLSIITSRVWSNRDIVDSQRAANFPRSRAVIPKHLHCVRSARTAASKAVARRSKGH
jgi:hypothetical protein